MLLSFILSLSFSCKKDKEEVQPEVTQAKKYRISKVIKSFDGKTSQIAYEYDDLGRVIVRNSTSGGSFNTFYYSYGSDNRLDELNYNVNGHLGVAKYTYKQDTTTITQTNLDMNKVIFVTNYILNDKGMVVKRDYMKKNSEDGAYDIVVKSAYFTYDVKGENLALLRDGDDQTTYSYYLVPNVYKSVSHDVFSKANTTNKKNLVKTETTNRGTIISWDYEFNEHDLPVKGTKSVNGVVEDNLEFFYEEY